MVYIKNDDEKMKIKLFIMSFYVSSFVLNFQQSLQAFIINYNE